MKVPSGQIFDHEDIQFSRRMVECGFIQWRKEPFVLKSKVSSRVYVSGRDDITDNPLFEWEVGQRIAKIVAKETRRDFRPCLIGIPTTGTTLAQAGAMVSVQDNTASSRLICHRVMRQKRKEYGVHTSWVDGTPNHSLHHYWLVDNVVTDGASKIEAAGKLHEDGYDISKVSCLILVDREQGSRERLAAIGFEKIVFAYRLLDLTFAFGELGLWPKDAVTHVEEEIRLHQLK